MPVCGQVFTNKMATLCRSNSPLVTACSKHTPANVQLYARLTQVYVVMQPMGCNKLTQGKEALMKVMLIQLADKASILSVTLAHCIAGGNNFVCVLIWVHI